MLAQMQAKLTSYDTRLRQRQPIQLRDLLGDLARRQLIEPDLRTGFAGFPIITAKTHVSTFSFNGNSQRPNFRLALEPDVQTVAALTTDHDTPITTFTRFQCLNRTRCERPDLQGHKLFSRPTSRPT